MFIIKKIKYSVQEKKVVVATILSFLVSVLFFSLIMLTIFRDGSKNIKIYIDSNFPAVFNNLSISLRSNVSGIDIPNGTEKPVKIISSDYDTLAVTLCADSRDFVNNEERVDAFYNIYVTGNTPFAEKNYKTENKVWPSNNSWRPCFTHEQSVDYKLSDLDEAVFKIQILMSSNFVLPEEESKTAIGKSYVDLTLIGTDNDGFAESMLPFIEAMPGNYEQIKDSSHNYKFITASPIDSFGKKIKMPTYRFYVINPALKNELQKKALILTLLLGISLTFFCDGLWTLFLERSARKNSIADSL